MTAPGLYSWSQFRGTVSSKQAFRLDRLEREWRESGVRTDLREWDNIKDKRHLGEQNQGLSFILLDMESAHNLNTTLQYHIIPWRFLKAMAPAESSRLHCDSDITRTIKGIVCRICHWVFLNWPLKFAHFLPSQLCQMHMFIPIVQSRPCCAHNECCKLHYCRNITSVGKMLALICPTENRPTLLCSALFPSVLTRTC